MTKENPLCSISILIFYDTKRTLILTFIDIFAFHIRH